MTTHFTQNPYDDPGDKFDPLKWDLTENDLHKIILDGYLYKVRHPDNVFVLHHIRQEMNRLCKYLNNHIKDYEKHTREMINLFLDIHYHNGGKRYILSEMTQNSKGFDGMNKPRFRFIDLNAPSIGLDGQLRPSYRDIFIKIDIPKNELKNLILHEISHTFANHCRFRWDDHGPDFKFCEDILKNVAQKIKFLER